MWYIDMACKKSLLVPSLPDPVLLECDGRGSGYTRLVYITYLFLICFTFVPSTLKADQVSMVVYVVMKLGQAHTCRLDS